MECQIFISMKFLDLLKENNEKYYVSDSDIHNKGVFAKQNLKKGDEIGLLHTINELYSDYSFEELGHYHNHSNKPNCHNKLIDNKRYLVASKDIKKGDELTTDYTLQPDLEQPKNFSMKENKMTPQKDGYRTYSPFKNFDYIIINGGGVDCDNIVYDLILIGDDKEIKFCKKDSGSHYFKNSNKVIEIPLKNGENHKDILRDTKSFNKWVNQKIKTFKDKNTVIDFLS